MAAEQEAARLAAAEKEARLAAEEEGAARLAAEQEAARLAAVEEEAVRLAAAEEEAARLVAEQEAARLAAVEEEARLAAEQEAARLVAEQEAVRLAAAEEEAARLVAEQEAVRLAAVEEEAARLAAADAGLAASGATAAGEVFDLKPSLQETMPEGPEAPPAEELPVDVPVEVPEAPPALAAEHVEPESDRRPADAALAELKERATAVEPTAPEQPDEVASVDERVEVVAAAQRAEVLSGPARWVPAEEDDQLAMIPFVLPDRVRTPLRLNLRRYAPAIGIGLALATLAAWLLLGS